MIVRPLQLKIKLKILLRRQKKYLTLYSNGSKTQESNRNKCHALFSTNKHLNKIAEYTVGNSDCEKLIVVKIDVNFKV